MKSIKRKRKATEEKNDLDDSAEQTPLKKIKGEKEKSTVKKCSSTVTKEDKSAVNKGEKTRLALEARKPINNKYVGAHVSISGGIYNAVHEAVELGARAFSMFLKSQRTWKNKPLSDEDAEKFKSALKDNGYTPDMVIPHGSYLMNCGSSDEEVFTKSRAMLLDEIQRCDKLGLIMFNFHPGSTCGKITSEESIEKIAECINYVHEETPKSKVITVLENMSCQGNTIGGKFEELRDIISKVENRSRVGVCLDTCHAFAAGFDLRNKDGFEKTMTHFDKVIGLKYLKAVHLNDSKGDLGCHKDRHENIGKGKLGKDAFSHIMNDSRFENIPMVLETPGGIYQAEIKTLYKLCK